MCVFAAVCYFVICWQTNVPILHSELLELPFIRLFLQKLRNVCISHPERAFGCRSLLVYPEDQPVFNPNGAVRVRLPVTHEVAGSAPAKILFKQSVLEQKTVEDRRQGDLSRAKNGSRTGRREGEDLTPVLEQKCPQDR